jgi:hypothetical protein
MGAPGGAGGEDVPLQAASVATRNQNKTNVFSSQILAALSALEIDRALLAPEIGLGQAIPEGDHIFSFEFKPTGKADIAKGKGVPASITLLVDGAPVGKGDLPVTIPLSLGLASSTALQSPTRSPAPSANGWARARRSRPLTIIT